jgi:hypothetical protein
MRDRYQEILTRWVATFLGAELLSEATPTNTLKLLCEQNEACDESKG